MIIVINLVDIIILCLFLLIIHDLWAILLKFLVHSVHLLLDLAAPNFSVLSLFRPILKCVRLTQLLSLVFTSLLALSHIRVHAHGLLVLAASNYYRTTFKIHGVGSCLPTIVGYSVEAAKNHPLVNFREILTLIH